MDATARREEERLAAVRRYDILDTPPDGSFDTITALAARALNVPIAIVSIVDRDRIWFKSHHGLEADEIGRDPGLCASAILQDDSWIVTDAAADPRTLTNPLVAGDLGLRFYVGVPLTISTGHNLGTLCAIDTAPRSVSQSELDTLKDLAAIVVNELDLRLAAKRTIAVEAELRQRSQELVEALQQIALPDTMPTVDGLDIWATYSASTTTRVGGDWYDAFEVDDHTVAVAVGDVSGHDLGAATCMGQIRNAMRAYAHQHLTPAAVAHQLELLVRSLPGHHFATLAYVLLDPTTGHYRAVNAGHPPPLVIHGGHSHRIAWPPAPPVGLYIDHAYQPIVGRLEADQGLMLYTDGLVERRGEAIDDGIERLIATLDGVAGDVERAIEALTAGRELVDDVAALVVSRTGRSD